MFAEWTPSQRKKEKKQCEGEGGGAYLAVKAIIDCMKGLLSRLEF